MAANPRIVQLLTEVLNEAINRPAPKPPQWPAPGLEAEMERNRANKQVGGPRAAAPANSAPPPTASGDPLKLATDMADKSAGRQDDLMRLTGAALDPQATEKAYDKADYIKNKPEFLARKRVDAWKRFGGPEPSRQDFELTGTTREEAIAARKELASRNRKATAAERLGRAWKGTTGSASLVSADGRSIESPSRPLTLDERFELLRKGAAGLL